MNQKPLHSQSMVFTLEEDAPVAHSNTSASTHHAQTDDDTADWERRLERLRQTKQRQSSPTLPIDDIFATAPVVASGGRSAIRRDVRHHGQHAERTPVAEPAPELLGPVQRERVYRAYLQQWQHQTSLAAEQQQAALNDTAVLLQEDWLAAQECLQYASADTPTGCVVRLNTQTEETEVLPAPAQPETAPPEAAQHQTAAAMAEASENTSTTASAVAPIEVHLHVIEPQGVHGRAVLCLSETDLLARLDEKLRPHLADAMAGMVRVAVQKQTAQLVSQLQQQLLAEIPATVAEVLQHNLAHIMRQIKQEQSR